MSIHRLAVIAFALHGFAASAAGCGSSSPVVSSSDERTSVSPTQEEWLAFGNAMQGSWHSVLPEGRNVRINYRWISNQSALLETFVTQSGRETISVFSNHDSRMRLTHYCGQGNQAHLELREFRDGNFSFVRYADTGVDAEEAVMNRRTIRTRSDRMELVEEYESSNGAVESETILLERDAT